MTPPSDFVQVQLSPSGAALAGESGVVRISNGHFSYVFSATPTRVLTSEWARVLSLKVCQGQPILMLAPDVAALKPAKPAPSRANYPTASHTDAPAQPATETANEVK